MIDTPRIAQTAVVVLVLGTVPAGCGAADTSSSGATVRDSAGIRIVELPATSPAAHRIEVRGDAGFSVSASLEFGRIADVDAAGAVVAVLDGLAAAVTTLDTTGSVIARFGRAGGGPGEFDPRGLASGAGRSAERPRSPTASGSRRSRAR